ncbi:MAG: hypothetical protein JWL90_632 [Chthoniobacteraceae bacterium]|nr:hypothetical protein [Chthoniobacteraceae bacterium]MDB6171054.1 hypothetical protein [Chthoniobacteraceae bacterium]
MKRLFLQLLTLAFATAGFCAEPARLLEKANVLPLALEDAFQFRKTKTFLNDPVVYKPTVDEMISFERQRINFGAVNQFDRRERYGHYFTFFWRSTRKTDLTVRLEYRQENLGSYVQAQDKVYAAAKGNFKSDFKVVGDDYNKDGKITAWRALLIENGKIVALNQSFLWN